jgi:hypothetical protein
MQDRLDACEAAFTGACASKKGLTKLVNFQGTGLTLATFVAGPYNNNDWISDLDYVLKVIGFKSGSFMYNKVGQGGTKNETATATSNYTEHMRCHFAQCADAMEAIFQPIGRDLGKVMGYALPCETELVACQTANPDSSVAKPTGSLANLDVKYAIPAAGAASSSVCQPEKGQMAYKKGYKLNEWTSKADGTCSKGTATMSVATRALQKCLAKSRAAAYQEGFNCLSSVGGADCGQKYMGTKCVIPTAAPTAAPKANGTATTKANGTATTATAPAGDTSETARFARVSTAVGGLSLVSAGLLGLLMCF